MLAADSQVIQAIKGLVDDQAKEIVLSKDLCLDGREHHFSTKILNEIKPMAPPLAALVSVRTLQGFADLIRHKLEGLDTAKFLIHIEDEATVSLITKETDVHGRRLTLVKAKPVDFTQFEFGNWIQHDDFVIKLASLFSDSEAPSGQQNDRAYVIKIAGSLTSGESVVSESDAFTQRITVRAGMELPTQIEIKPYVNLAPYRIFPECQQPFSKFIFRARVSESKTPALMLTEADGGLWQVNAINEVRRLLATFDTGIEIVA